MSDDMKAEISLEINTTGSELVDALNKKLRDLETRIKRINDGMKSAAKAAAISTGSQTRSGANIDPGKQARDAVRDLRSRFTFESRMASQRLREKRANQREFVARMWEQRRAEAKSLIQGAGSRSLAAGKTVSLLTDSCFRHRLPRRRRCARRTGWGLCSLCRVTGRWALEGALRQL